MDIFGPGWEGHPASFFERWRETVNDDDVVLVPGDISWAMRFEDALVDLDDIAQLPGTKVLLRGNHDYWWPSISRLRGALPPGMLALQNDALLVKGIVVAGTRGWICPGTHGFTEQDDKVYRRELERLKLSLKAAERLEGNYRVVMLHFPPTNSRLEPSGFTQLITAAAPDALVYGHVHGEQVGLLKELDDVAVHFVAADALGFVPRLVHDFGEGGAQ